MRKIAKTTSDRVSGRLSSTALHIAALVFLVLIAYAGSVAGAFVYDDQRVVLANPLLGHWDHHTLAVIFTRDYWGAYNPDDLDPQVESSYYRPFLHLYELVVFELAGKSPAGWHLLSILLHASAAVLVMLVLDRSLLAATSLPQKTCRMLALLAAAIFAAHPVQGEAVAWVAAFANPLAAIFSLTAFYCYLTYRSRPSYYLLTTASLLLAAALLTKEVAAVVVLLTAAHELWVFNRQSPLPARLRAAAGPVLAFASVTGGYFALRYAVLHGLSAEGRNLNFPEDASLTLADNLCTLPSLLMAYLKLAIWPFGHSMMYASSYIRSFNTAAFWLPFGAALVGGGLMTWWSRRVPEVRIALAWTLIPLLPHLNTRVFFSEEIVHDRYLYLSEVGVALLMSVGLRRGAGQLRLPGPVRLGVASVTLAALCAATAAQNMQWQNEEVLWAHAAAHAPHSRVPHLALGMLAESRQDYDRALDEYAAALRINPDIIDALNNQAFVYAHLGRWGEATANFKRIIELTPDKAVAHFNLSVAYGAQQRFVEAAREKQIAIELGLPGALELMRPKGGQK